MISDKNFYACESHVDCIIDDFINLYGLTPNLNLNDININYVCCNYCNKIAKYVLDFIEI